MLTVDEAVFALIDFYDTPDKLDRFLTDPGGFLDYDEPLVGENGPMVTDEVAAQAIERVAQMAKMARDEIALTPYQASYFDVLDEMVAKVWPAGSSDAIQTTRCARGCCWALIGLGPAGDLAVKVHAVDGDCFEPHLLTVLPEAQVIMDNPGPLFPAWFAPDFLSMYLEALTDQVPAS